MHRLGYEADDLNKINAIHITGTKGKGSTSAFADSILRALAPTARTGLYTSPHLVAVRERIRINGKPLAEEVFAKYFFEVWDKWETNNKMKDDDTPEKPAYFRYLTFMAFHVFLQEKVDATVLEVGVGGTYDSTNLIPQPIVAGISALGIDHIFVLGKTIPEIATQKGGIYKPGVPALAISQPAEGLDVLRSRAAELHASSFSVVPTLPSLSHLKLGLAGAHQRTNASLAIALVRAFLASPRLPAVFAPHALPSSTESTLPSSIISPDPLPKEIVEGLERTSWPGRCQVEKDTVEERLSWFLDGAHTVESLVCCGEWFREVALGDESRKANDRILIFNCTSGRSGLSLLGTLLDTLALSSSSPPPFSQVIFCTSTTYSSGTSKGDLVSNSVDPHDLETLATQRELADVWRELTKDSGTDIKVHVLPSIEDAVKLARGVAKNVDVDVLVTGSLILVGGVFALTSTPTPSLNHVSPTPSPQLEKHERAEQPRVLNAEVEVERRAKVDEASEKKRAKKFTKKEEREADKRGKASALMESDSESESSVTVVEPKSTDHSIEAIEARALARIIEMRDARRKGGRPAKSRASTAAVAVADPPAEEPTEEEEEESEEDTKPIVLSPEMEAVQARAFESFQRLMAAERAQAKSSKAHVSGTKKRLNAAPSGPNSSPTPSGANATSATKKRSKAASDENAQQPAANESIEDDRAAKKRRKREKKARKLAKQASQKSGDISEDLEGDEETEERKRRRKEKGKGRMREEDAHASS
ncbi:hypothetical protein RQP46_008961 [Phenoliferia psychrophenolica]